MFLKISFYLTVIYLLFVSGLLSCVTNSQKVNRSSFNEVQFQKLEKALKLMEQKDFLRAGQLYDSLSMNSKNSSVKILSLYNSGLAYKSAGDCETSLSRFRSVLDKSFKKLLEYQAISLLEISSVYECLGKNDMSLSSLKDLEKKIKYLTLSFQQILYPARLSIAWSQQGDFKKANEYQSLSLTKILQYKKGLAQKDLKKELARLFYLMGKSYMKKEHLQTKPFIFSFIYHQIFLLQSLFMEDEKWSSLATVELDRLFDNLAFLLSQTENKEQYKKIVEKSLKIGFSFIEEEKSKDWKNYYYKKSKQIDKIFSGESQQPNQIEKHNKAKTQTKKLN